MSQKIKYMNSFKEPLIDVFKIMVISYYHSCTLFRCRTRNGDACRNYGEMKLLMHYVDATSWIRGCDHGAS